MNIKNALCFFGNAIGVYAGVFFFKKYFIYFYSIIICWLCGETALDIYREKY